MISTPDKAFEDFAKGLVPSQNSVDPETLRKARDWYRSFAGAHAVPMTDRDMVEIYLELN
jgi:hypothetical protein